MELVPLFHFYPHPRTCLETGDGRERYRDRNIDVREKHQPAAASTCPKQGPNPQPRHVPRPGIKLVTFRCRRQCSDQLSHIIQGNQCPFSQGQRTLSSLMPCENTMARWWSTNQRVGSMTSLAVESAGTLILDLPASRPMRNKCLLCKPHSPRYCCGSLSRLDTHLYVSKPVGKIPF